MESEYGVIFDMDGVLADTGPIHYESWVKLANEIGSRFPKELFERTFGQQSSAIVRMLVSPNTEDSKIIEWAALKEEYFRDMVKDKLFPLPGVISILKTLQMNGFKLAVGSSGPPENVELLLNTLKIKKYFEVIITAAEVKKGKPEPDVFLIAANALNVLSENSIVIEDAPVGIEAAKRAGMKVIALTTTHDEKELLDADIIVKDLSYIGLKEIKDLLNIKK